MGAGKLLREGSKWALPKVEKAIRAWHGSPHHFDPEPDAPYGRFKDKAIGSGEGSQSYGRGHYLAEERDVGEEYRRVLSRDQPGALYETNIHADPDRFLAWDKPLAEQGHIVDALKKSRSSTVRDLMASPDFQKLDDTRIVYGTDIGPVTGQTLHGQLSYNMTGKPSSAQASGALMKAGVPGIKYLDQGSRAAAKGTNNFTVFDPKIIEIIGKYGIAGALGAGLITQEQAEAAQAQGYGEAAPMDRTALAAKLAPDPERFGR